MNEYTKQGKDFLGKYELQLNIRESVPQKSPVWSKDKKHGINYWVELSDKKHNVYGFDFWGSIANKENYPYPKRPTAYDILACLNTYDDGITFDEFCSSYGYSTDSREAENTFKRVELQTAELKKILSDEAQEALNEIN